MVGPKKTKIRAGYLAKLTTGVVLLGLVFLHPKLAYSGMFELSAGFSYNRVNYGSEQNYNLTKRWTGSIGYYFSETSEVEVDFSDVVDKTLISGYQDTTFHDQIYSANWIQSLLPRTARIQPYLRIGVGQLNRNASGEYGNGAVPASQVDSLTGVLGAGTKFPIVSQLGFKCEAISYLKGAAIGTYKDNIAITLGLSFYF